jgi:hypothetical protein
VKIYFKIKDKSQISIIIDLILLKKPFLFRHLKSYYIYHFNNKIFFNQNGSFQLIHSPKAKNFAPPITPNKYFLLAKYLIHL